MTKAVKSLFAFIAGFGVIAIVAWFAICIACFVLTIYGLIVAFTANIWLGIIALVLEPAPFVIGVAQWAFGYNIPEHILRALQH